MRRRDAVLIAVLVNAGLMVFLFTLAVTGHDESSQTRPLPSQGELVELIPNPADEGLFQEPTLLAQSPCLDPSGDAEMTFVPTVSLGDPEQGVLAAGPITSAASTPATPAKSYTVKKGDALERIAKQHHVTVAALMKANQLKNTSKLSIGQVLTIPGSAGTTVASAARSTAAAEVEANKSSTTQMASKYYTVRKGDNVWAIATRHHMKTEELLRLNQLTPEMARRLRPGDRLRVQ